MCGDRARVPLFFWCCVLGSIFTNKDLVHRRSILEGQKEMLGLYNMQSTGTVSKSLQLEKKTSIIESETWALRDLSRDQPTGTSQDYCSNMFQLAWLSVP